MRWLIGFIVGFVAWGVGVFAFAQIIGSLRMRQRLFLFPVATWSAILAGEYFLARWIVPGHMTAFYVGNVVSFVMIIMQRKIE